MTMNPGAVTTTGSGTTTTINNLNPGTYTFTVTAVGSCPSPATGNVTINTQPTPLTAPVVGTITQPDCATATGSVALSGLPAGNWTLTMNPGAVTTTGSGTTTTINNLNPGTYTFTVTAVGSCPSPAKIGRATCRERTQMTAPVVGTNNKTD